MSYTAIVNPAARNGKTGRRLSALQEACRRAGLAMAWQTTEGPGHAAELARTAAATSDAVVAVGGDGTIHEVSRGLIASGTGTPLGILPCGTGNDFVKALPIPRRLPDAVAALARSSPVPIDYGLVRWRDGGEMRQEPFVNAVGFGFDARVAAEGPFFKFLPGVGAYLYAVLRTLARWSSPRCRLSAGLPDAPGAVLFDGPLFLATMGNGVSSGGGIYLTPAAEPDDGLLDLCIIEDPSRWRVLLLLSLALRGRHGGAREVHLSRRRSVHLTSSAPLYVHTDGEIVATVAREIEVEIVPGGLSLLLAPPR